MTHDLTHASFFSGVGGVDLGLERAGWRTVSISEVDPYANAVLAHHWPDVPNLGDIVALAHAEGGAQEQPAGQHVSDAAGHPDWWDATLWSGGFPCQDLSVAGKRRGFGINRDTEGARPPGEQHGHDRGLAEGTRSGLAFAFLRLVAVHRPRAILLENVPGLLSSHGGRDLGALLGAMVELGYGVAWRELDAKHFGVPQRRRRIFLLGLRSEADDPDGRVAADRAAAVLAVGTRCDRHPAPGGKKGTVPASGPRRGASLVGGGNSAPQSQRVFGTDGESPALSVQNRYGGPQAPAILANTVAGDGSTIDRADGPINYVVGGPPPDPSGVRAPDGLAGRLDDRAGMVRAFTKSRRAQTDHDHETWVEGDATPTLNGFDSSAVRATTVISQSLDQKKGGVDDNEAQSGLAMGGLIMDTDPLLPAGLDSNRYRCCGNGVVAPVAEWIGARLAAYLT